MKQNDLVRMPISSIQGIANCGMALLSTLHMV